MKTLKGTLRFVALGCMLATPTPLLADLTLAQQPLFVGHGAGPNLLFILDDSGSMRWGFMPDDLVDGRITSGSNCSNRVSFAGVKNLCALTAKNRAFLVSSHMNKVYFNPDITYTPPIRADGTRYPNASFTSAYANGYAQTNAIDLSTSYRALLDDYYYFNTYNGGGFTITPDGNAGAAFYYKRKNNCTGDYDDKCYELVRPIPDNQKQNFANWFSYYRTRLMVAKAGIGEAFNGLPSQFRLGWGQINTEKQDVDDVRGVDAVIQGVRAYEGSHRTSFYNWLYTAKASGGTPLLAALNGAGTYYENSQQSWTDNPGQPYNASTNPERQCRQAYTILMTDGYYSDSLSRKHASYQADDTDGEAIPNPKGANYRYRPVYPYKDGHSRSTTLADVAMYYWKRDLRPNLGNYVPTTAKNPAYWQHMVTYGVGLGVSGSVDPDDAFAAIETGAVIDWWRGTDDEKKLNDLLHAAVNSRGGFFSAADPAEFSRDLSNMIVDITAEAGSATGVEFNVSSFEQDGLIFAAEFDPNSWSGDLKAASLGQGDTPVVPDFNTNSAWSAATKLNNRDLATSPREIITYANGMGVPFRWDNLTNTQKADLKYGNASDAVAQQRLDYIRGDRSREGQDGFRRRASRLGDIINSSPEYVGAPNTMWPDANPFGTDSARYSSFVSSNGNRTPVVYVGANDGMLHGFKATSTNDGGQELLAYIPSFVYSSSDSEGLHYLVQQSYQHRYYVDLPLRQQDVYTKGRAADGGVTADKAWRTILLGGGRVGAKGVFALDVTNPADFSENNAKKLVLWEFSAANDNRLGFNLEPPIVAMAKWGANDIRWTAFVANGYNSQTASTGFFMLDIEKGLDGWQEGDYRYVQFSTTGGGLSPLTVLDTDGDYVADRLYAGDLSGNLWVADGQSGTWASAYSANGTAQPLFAGNQPITAAPAVASNRAKPRAGNLPNLMVYFGTGKYLESGDATSTTTQSIYGVWDRGNTNIKQENLVQRTLTTGQLELDGETRTVRYSNGDDLNFDTYKGWYVNLPSTRERVIHSAQVRGEFIYVNSMIPDQDPCQAGGTGWLMAFGLDGRTPTKRAFLEFPSPVVGYQIEGIPNPSTIMGNYRFTSNTKRGVDLVEIPPLSGTVAGAGRRGWAELVE